MDSMHHLVPYSLTIYPFSRAFSCLNGTCDRFASDPPEFFSAAAIEIFRIFAVRDGMAFSPGFELFTRPLRLQTAPKRTGRPSEINPNQIISKSKLPIGHCF